MQYETLRQGKPSGSTEPSRSMSSDSLVFRLQRVRQFNSSSNSTKLTNNRSKFTPSMTQREVLGGVGVGGGGG